MQHPFARYIVRTHSYAIKFISISKDSGSSRLEEKHYGYGSNRCRVISYLVWSGDVLVFQFMNKPVHTTILYRAAAQHNVMASFLDRDQSFQ